MLAKITTTPSIAVTKTTTTSNDAHHYFLPLQYITPHPNMSSDSDDSRSPLPPGVSREKYDKLKADYRKIQREEGVGRERQFLS